MNDNLIIDKIEKFFEKEYFSKYKDVLFFKNENGEYELFDRYIISKCNNLYQISSQYFTENKLFSNLRNAVTWCIFDNRNKLPECKRIEYLDKMLAGADVNIIVHKKLINKENDLEYKLIYASKLSQEEARKKQMLNEMDKFIKESQRWQAIKFAAK